MPGENRANKVTKDPAKTGPMKLHYVVFASVMKA
jgi:hypothetical protein